MRKKNHQFKLLDSQLGSYKGKVEYKSDVTNEQIADLVTRFKAIEPQLKAKGIDWREEVVTSMSITKPQLANVIANNIRNEVYRQDFMKKGEQLYKQLQKKIA